MVKDHYLGYLILDMRQAYISFTLILYCLIAYGQSYDELKLNTLDAFKPQVGNWVLVGDVMMDRKKDVHEYGNEGVTFSSGMGVLLNLNDKQKKDALLTAWEHGDIELELEFMLPRGSNSGIYLQGRYEVQLYDSWGVGVPKFSDLGGLYRNWETNPSESYQGKAPLVNAAKAPGLWQKMFISFDAPKFDMTGKKIKNAKFNLVKINGTTVHENYEIPLPTGGPIDKKEAALGPLMIQGDHGAVAFKNIKYRLIENKPIAIGLVTYKYWKGTYQYENEFQNKMPDKSGTSQNGLTWEVSGDKGLFGLHLSCDLTTPLSENYYIKNEYNGALALYLDGKAVYQNRIGWDWDKFDFYPVALTAGKHKLDIYYSRKTTWLEPNLGIFIKSDHLHEQALHPFSSYKVRQVVSPIIDKVKEKPRLLRAFLDFNGQEALRRTHTIGVGDPSKIHYIYDLALGSISCIWKGEFVDATPMWHDRGDGSFKPLADAIYLFNTPQIEAETSAEEKEEAFIPKGYKLNSETGTPIFRHSIHGMQIEDEIYADAILHGLTREIRFNTVKAGTQVVIAKAKEIKQLDNGSYLIDGKYYIESLDPMQIKNKDGMYQLTATPAEQKVRYNIIW